MTKKNVFIALAVVVVVGLTGILIYQSQHKDIPRSTQTQATKPTKPVLEEKYYFDDTYYHKTIDCPGRTRAMGEGKMDKKGAELYGLKPCPKCFPEAYR